MLLDLRALEESATVVAPLAPPLAPQVFGAGPPPRKHTYVFPRHDREALLALLAFGEIDEDEFAALEAELPDQLVVVR